jgi:hypothetical protein
MKTTAFQSLSGPMRALFAYRYARVALSSLIGFMFLFVGVYHRAGSRGGDLVWFLLLFVVCQLFAFRRFRHVRSAQDEEYFHAAVARREARLATERERSGPVLGKKCKECRQRIVVEHDGCRCDTCSAAVHVDCRRAHRAAKHTERVAAYR